jgi:uncharacterized membrane protein (DUF4010 family)
MENLVNLEPWWRFGAALLIGALIGIEREFVQQQEDSSGFAGIRTFAIISLVGALAAFAAQLRGIEIFLISYGGFILLLAGNRVASVILGRTTGMTTEVVAVLTPLLGALVIWDQAELAAALGVITALMLALKPGLHRLARRMSNEDLRATLQFGLISLVILPLLPDQSFGPLGVLNPFRIWVLVILVSGISFIGYLLMKFSDPTEGTSLAGLFGGLVSSTATTVSFAGRSRDSSGLSTLAAIAILLASAVSFPRIFIETLAVYPPLLELLTLPLVGMVLAALLSAAYYWRQQSEQAQQDTSPVLDVANPLRLRTALIFALLFTLVLLGVAYANENMGPAGIYLVGALSGLTGVDSITLSVSKLASNATIDLASGSIAILIATLVNLIFKVGLAHFLGSARLRNIVLRSSAIIILVGALTTGLSFALFG